MQAFPIWGAATFPGLGGAGPRSSDQVKACGSGWADPPACRHSTVTSSTRCRDPECASRRRWMVLIMFWGSSTGLTRQGMTVRPSFGTIRDRAGGALPPVCKQDEEVADAHRAVVVQISRAVVAVGTRTPRSQQNQQVAHTNYAIAVNIARLIKHERENPS